MKELLTFGQQVFSWTWKTSLQAAFLVVLIVLLQKLLARCLTPRLRYALSLLVVCRLLLPVAPPSPLSLENLLVGTGPPAETTTLALGGMKSAFPTSSVIHPADLSLASADLKSGPGISWADALALGWLCGFLTLIVCAVWQYAGWRRLIRSGEQLSHVRLLEMLDAARKAMGVRCPVTLVSVAGLSSPAVFGIWRVFLLLPESALLHLSSHELRLVFMHEMAHVRRKDALLNVALMAVQFLHWFNPLVWLALHRLRVDRELVCDAMVIQRAGEGERLNYGQLLIRLMENFSTAARVFPTAIPVVGSKREIKRRILAVKHGRRTSLFSLTATGLGAVVVVSATFTGATEQVLAPNAARESVVPLSQNDTRALGFDWYLGNLLMSNGSVVSSAGTQPYFNGAPAAVNPGDRSPGTTERNNLRITNSATATNGAIIRHGPIVITGNELDFDYETGQVLARGQVRVEQNGQIWSGEQLTYNLKTNHTALEQYVSEVQIRVVGAQLVEEADIRTNIHVQVGVPFDQAAVDQDVRDLYASGLFYNVRVSNKKTDEGTKLLYIVQCNPRLVGLEFKGNATFSDLDLQKTVSSRVGGFLNEKRLFLDGQQIQEKYEKAGYQGTLVKCVIHIDEAVGEATATFQITETH